MTENLSGKGKFFRKEEVMVVVVFYAGTVIGALIGVVVMALLRMAKDVEEQKAEDLTNI
jgi:predicted membrane-bound spermidine synthase